MTASQIGGFLSNGGGRWLVGILLGVLFSLLSVLWMGHGGQISKLDDRVEKIDTIQRARGDRVTVLGDRTKVADRGGGCAAGRGEAAPVATAQPRLKGEVMSKIDRWLTERARESRKPKAEEPAVELAADPEPQTKPDWVDEWLDCIREGQVSYGHVFPPYQAWSSEFIWPSMLQPDWK